MHAYQGCRGVNNTLRIADKRIKLLKCDAELQQNVDIIIATGTCVLPQVHTQITHLVCFGIEGAVR